MSQQLTVINIAGSPRELGRSHGEQCRDRIATELATALEPLAGRWGLSINDALERFAVFRPMFQQVAPHLLDEMEGIAEGAGRSFAEILFLNARHGGVSAFDDGCTAFAARPPATPDGRVLAGQNKDTGIGSLDRYYLLRMKPTSGPGMLMLTYPGEIGHIGLNSSGLALFGNALYGRRAALGGPHNLARRPMLECGSVAEAGAVFDRLENWADGNYLVADSRGNIEDYEVLAGTPRALQPRDAVITHGNHVLHPDHEQHEDYGEANVQSVPRACRLRDLLAARAGSLSPKDCMEALADHEHRPQSLCRHAAPIRDGGEAWTTCSLVADLKERVLHVALGNPCETAFTAYGFDR